MSTYAWIIDKDHIADEDEPKGTYSNAATLYGPSDASDDQVTQLASGEGVAFRMYDDDGILYYEGRIILPADDDPDATGDEEFGPLDDFGMVNAGATEIHYKDANGAWKGI